MCQIGLNKTSQKTEQFIYTQVSVEFSLLKTPTETSLDYLSKESRVTLACLYRTPGRSFMLQLISIDSGHFIS